MLNNRNQVDIHRTVVEIVIDSLRIIKSHRVTLGQEAKPKMKIEKMILTREDFISLQNS